MNSLMDNISLVTSATDIEGSLEPWFHWLHEAGVQLIGSPKSAFAFFNEEDGVLHIFAKNSDCIDVSTSHGLESNALLEAQDEGAVFAVSGGKAICIVDNWVATGSSYGEAAFKALSARLREKSKKANG